INGFALALVGLAILSPGGATGFEVDRHGDMTRAVLNDPQVNPTGFPFVPAAIAGSEAPDVQACTLYCYGPFPLCAWLPLCLLGNIFGDPSQQPLNHFDSCVSAADFDAAAQVANDRSGAAASALLGIASFVGPLTASQLKTAHEAMFTFGQALHGLQDFYAH